jgi:hypothetical protein
MASTGRLLADSGEKKFSSLLREPVDLVSISGDPITKVRLLATMYVWGLPVGNAFTRIPYLYVEKHRKVRIVDSVALRANALKAIARAVP